MSEVKAAGRLCVWVCPDCGGTANKGVGHVTHVDCLVERGEAVSRCRTVEYVPATDSPDREPPYAYDIQFSDGTSTLVYASGPAEPEHKNIPLYRNPPDRSDGLREALENLTGAVQPLLAESRSFKHGEPLTLLKVPLLPDELTEARDALAAARLALKAESK